MEKWTDTQNFADAGEKSTLIASAHRAAIRSIERVVTETVTPHDPLYAAEGIEKCSAPAAFGAYWRRG